MKTGRMNSLIKTNVITEMECCSNFAYVLRDSNTFLSTEYKVLQSSTGGCFVKCLKMMLNGQIQLYYLTESLRPLSAILSSVGEEEYPTIVKNLLDDVIEIKNNGFLTCRNVDISFEKIFVNPVDQKVSLVYLPLGKHVFDSSSEFEDTLRSLIAKFIDPDRSFSSRKIKRLLSDLENETFTLEDIRKRLDSETDDLPAAHEKQKEADPDTVSAPDPASESHILKLVALNAPMTFEIIVNKTDFTIGKRDTNDGVISFNKMISRLHCMVTLEGGQYMITDLQSANGTYVNKVRLVPGQPVAVSNGDVVRLADSDFQIVME